MQRIIKIAKRLLIILLLLILLILISGYYLLGTESGYRHLPKLVNLLTPYQISYDQLQGHFFGTQQWKNLKILRKTQPEQGLQLQAEHLTMTFPFMELLSHHVHITQLQINNAVVHLPPNRETSEKKNSGIPNQLPTIQLPVQVDIDALKLNRVTLLTHQEKKLLSVENLAGEMHGIDHTITLKLDAAVELGETPQSTHVMSHLTGDIHLTGDYPLTLAGNADIQLPTKPLQTITLQVSGSALKPQLTLDATGWNRGSLTATGTLDLTNQQANIISRWKNINYDNHTMEIPTGEMQIHGPFQQIMVTLQSQVQGNDIPQLTLSGSAEITPQDINHINLLLHTLDGEVHINGELRYKESLSWNGQLLIQHLNGQAYDKKLNAALTGNIITSGQQTSEGLEASIDIQQLEGHWQQYPLLGHGKVLVKGKTGYINDFLIDFAGNQLIAQGKIEADNADLHAQLDAPALEHILPKLQGNVSGKIDITGQTLHPQINGQLTWHNLIVKQDNKTIFAARKGTLSANGTPQGLTVTIQTDGKGANMPTLEMTARAEVTPKTINQLNLTLNTLQGKAQLEGNIGLSPLTWDIQGHLRNINPQALIPTLNASINSELQAKGQWQNEKLHIDAQIKELTGRWQGQALAGHASVEIDDQTLNIDTVDFSVGQNHITSKGKISTDNLDLILNLNGKQLTQLYPSLKGSLIGTAEIHGKTTQPVIQATIQGQQLSYQTHHIDKATIILDTGMQIGEPFNNRVQLNGVSSSGQHWQNITLNTQGKFENHQLSLKTTDGEYNAELAATGGFSALNNWHGTLKQLQAQLQNQTWHMRQATPITLSPKNILLDNLCLADQYSALCIKIAKQNDTLIDYHIDQIDARSLKPFLPPTIKIAPQLKGNGKLTIAANGNMKGNADLHLTPGKIIATIKNQPPITLNVKAATVTSTFTDTQAQSKAEIAFENAGNLLATATVNNLRNNPLLHGELKINVPDIGKFKYLLPQVSELKGQVMGDMQFSGPVKQPKISGELLLKNGKVIIPAYATELKDIHLRLGAQQDGNISIEGNIGTPKGKLTANGVLHPQPLTLNLTLDGKDMLIANAKQMSVTVNPNFVITIEPQTGIVVKGNILIPQANISIPDTSSAVEPSEDVVIMDGKQQEDKALDPTDKTTPLRADISIRLGDSVYFKNKDVNIRLIGGLMVILRPNEQIQGKGRIEVAQGVYELYGQELDIKRGWITFNGNIANPILNILATREVDNVNVGAQVKGNVKNLRLALTSDPAMPDSAILSYLLLGHAPDSGTDTNSLLQTAAAIGTKGLFPDDLANKTGLDVFDLGIGGLKAGKYLMKNLYIGMKSDFFNNVTKFLARYKVTDRLNIEASSSQKDGNAVDMTYHFETD